MDLFHNSLWIVPASVFVAGLIGSPHCLSMCGPIVMSFSKMKRQLLAYQLGRMIAYTTAGALVGSFGQLALGSGRPRWLSILSASLIAAALLFNGYQTFARKPLHYRMPKFLSRIGEFFWSRLRRAQLAPNAAAAGAGFFTVFLPCGHLYTFLIGAVATGTAIQGAAFMFAFWLGSTPLLSLSGLGLQRVLRLTLPQRQRWAGALLIAAGLYSAVSFAWNVEAVSPRAHVHESNPQHETSDSHSCHQMGK